MTLRVWLLSLGARLSSFPRGVAVVSASFSSMTKSCPTVRTDHPRFTCSLALELFLLFAVGNCDAMNTRV